MNDRLRLVQSLLLEAIEIQDPAERSDFLARACGPDPKLRAEVEDFLLAHAEAGGFLPKEPAAGAAEAARARAAAALESPPVSGPALPRTPGDYIGRYKLLQKIGEGGCGVVYMAEQQEPVRRKVALKVIKLGMDTRQVVARFEAERQALALMDHPNIAKVLEAGATTTGRPYFVMELVRGCKITTYCDEHQCSTRERLELFIQVCQAVQHAHQKGIIHRDLKPSNILVTERDGLPVPKVIDFGIAKATGGLELTDKTLFTAFEQFMGTPAYMSPEQAHVGELDIDTRSDIYTLGVLLYELLTGKTPFETKALLASGLDELRRTIREKEPLKPSTRLRGEPAAELTGTARCRRTEPLKLVRAVKGDLDWIVLKCLEKDRRRRYETASALAMDVLHYLKLEPVAARPPSRLYEFQRTVRRHKLGFAAAAGVILALTIGLVGSIWELRRALRAESEETRLRVAAEQTQRDLGNSQREARLEAQKARLAEADAKEKLRGSYLAQAQAGRWSGRAGRRFEGLELLRKAADIRPGLELRNEAIACMALTDLRPINEWQSAPGEVSTRFDQRYERYAFPDARGTMHVCQTGDATELMRFPGYPCPFRPLEFSPNGRFLALAVGQDAFRVEVLDLDRQQPFLHLTASNCRVVSFNPDTHLLAIGYDREGPDWPIRIFDLATKEPVASFGHGSLPHKMRFHPGTSDLLLTSDFSPMVRLWNWRTGKLVRSFEHPDWVAEFDCSRDGELIAAGCADHRVYVWEADTGKQRAALQGHASVPMAPSFTADGEFLISGGWDGTLRLWELQEQRELTSRPVSGFIYPFSDVCNRFAITVGLGRHAILEVAPGLGYCALRSRIAPPQRGCGSCGFSPDGRLLLCRDGEGIRVWDVEARREINQLTVEGSYGQQAFFLGDATNVLFATTRGLENWGLDRQITDSISGFTFRRRFPLEPHNTYMALSSDGTRTAVGAEDGLHVLEASTGAEVRRLQPGYLDICVALDATGHMAATWSQTGKNVQIWDVGQSNLVREFSLHDASIQAAFSPNGCWVAIGDGLEYNVWDLRTGKRLYVLPRTSASVWAKLAFSPDSTLLALAVTRSTLQLVEAATGRQVATLEPPERMNIGWITFSPDGTRLAVAIWPGPILLWDLRAIRRQLASINLDWDLPSYN